MLSLILFLACGDKAEDTALTEPSTEPVVEDTAEEGEDTAEEGEDTAEDTAQAE